MKKFVFFILLILSLIIFPVFVACQPATTPSQPQTSAPQTQTTATVSELKVRFAAVSPPPPATLSVGYDYFQKRVGELSGGKITFENYYAGSLLAAAELLNGTQKRVTDMSMGLPLFFSTQLPLATFDGNFPFCPPDTSLAASIKVKMYDQIPALNEEHEKNGIKQLFMFGMGNYDLQSIMPIKTMDDLKGKKIAAAGAALTKWINGGGATGVNIPGAERYVALQRGTVDGSVMPIISAGDDKWGYEVCKYYTDVGLGAPAVMFMWANLDFWKSLSPEQQTIMEKAAQETQGWLPDQIKSKGSEYRETFKKNGVTFNAMSAADKAKWAEMLPDMPAEWANDMESKGLPGWQIVDTYIKLCKEAGYTWPREWGKR